MNILVTGATGFIGRSLVASLIERGDSVVAVSRNAGAAQRRLPQQVNVIEWPPAGGDCAEFNQHVGAARAVVNLAGEPVADHRWSSNQKRRLVDSRLRATRAIVDALARTDGPPPTLINGSALGYYGSRNGEELDENSPPGDDFLATLVVQWETEARRAEQFGARVVTVRSGIVLGMTGGALPKLLLPFKFFVGGVMGPAEQWISWIHIDDEVGVILKAIDVPAYAGPVNATSPAPVTMIELSHAIGRALKRPVWVPGLPLAMSLVFGERASSVFASQKVRPRKLQGAGYEFRFADLESTLAALPL